MFFSVYSPFSCMPTKLGFIQTTKMSMPVITLDSQSKQDITNPPHITKNLRNSSFSSYLDGSDKTLVLKLESPSTHGFSSSFSTPHDNVFLRKNTTDDHEIDVFDAEKYFNDELDLCPKVSCKNLSTDNHKNDDSFETLAIKEKPALSIRSESSWNSRSALLNRITRNQRPRKGHKKSFLATFGCNCSCVDMNSVDIDDHKGENCSVYGKSKQEDKNNDHLVRKSKSDYSSVKFDEPKLRIQTTKMQLQEGEDAAKKSLEVFGSPVLENGKKLTMLSCWDAISPEEIKIPSIATEMNNDDDDSDTSSDLFEIESLSKGNPFLSREASDSLSGCITPTTCYAPSEASIEWSVITASAADFSVLSDSDELGSTITTIPCPQKVAVNPKVISFKEIPKIRPGILSGCKSQKAVSVAGGAYRANEQGFSNARKLSTPMTRFHDEHKLAGFDARNRRQSFDARVLPQSRTGNAAHMLYT
ncbi:hypothetical protein CDL12_10174 [Handroanthus impetiginosus]|uniref:Protein PHYTOCHROME KINASE SUBSTRATE 1-like n=1 Tax=Handroanthus impetiginosus TaxID=429701 RepID=A0A2G9HHZ4_9LAMI|nr:hypothetical protein CDL12_10174 [Handroanthus impetiginosus]